MGRYFNAEMPEYIKNTIYTAPHDLIARGLDRKQQAFDKEQEAAELFKDKFKINYDIKDKDNVNALRDQYEGEADQISNMLSKDGNSKEAHRRIKALQRKLLKDREQGNISKIEASFNNIGRLQKQYQDAVDGGEDIETQRAILNNKIDAFRSDENVRGSYDNVAQFETAIATPELLQGEGKILDLAKKAVADSGKTIRTQPGGGYLIGKGSSWEVLSPEKLVALVEPEIKNSKNMSSYMKQQQALGLQDFSADGFYTTEKGKITGFSNNKVGNALKAASGLHFKKTSSEQTLKNDSLQNYKLKKKDEEGFQLSLATTYNTKALEVEEVEAQSNVMLNLKAKQDAGQELSQQQIEQLETAKSYHKSFVLKNIDKWMDLAQEHDFIDKERYPGGIQDLSQQERIDIAMEMAARANTEVPTETLREQAKQELLSRGVKDTGRAFQRQISSITAKKKRAISSFKDRIEDNFSNFKEDFSSSAVIQNVGTIVPALQDGQKPTQMEDISRKYMQNAYQTSKLVDVYEGTVSPFDRNNNLKSEGKVKLQGDATFSADDIEDIFTRAGANGPLDLIDKGYAKVIFRSRGDGFTTSHIEFTGLGREELGLSSDTPNSVNVVSKMTDNYNAAKTFEQIVRETPGNETNESMLNNMYEDRASLETAIFEFESIAAQADNAEDLAQIQNFDLGEGLTANFGSNNGKLVVTLLEDGKVVTRPIIMTDTQSMVNDIYHYKLNRQNNAE